MADAARAPVGHPLTVPSKNLRLTSKPSSLYCKVVMKMSCSPIVSEPASGVASAKLERRHALEMLLALVCPPLLAVATVILLIVWSESIGDLQSFRGDFQVLVPLNVTGAVLLAAVIFLDLRAVERLTALTAVEVRLELCASALVSLLFLAVWVTAQAGRDDASEVGAIILFICLPTLFVCAPLLWYSARAIQRTSLRAALLVGFVMAALWSGLQSQTEFGGGNEDRVLMFNSLLIALAVAVRLCVWGATEFRSASGPQINAFGVRREAERHAALAGMPAMEKRCRRFALPPQSTILATSEDAERVQSRAERIGP